jgi:O-antigen/teichoic acid export membrane protein
VTKGSPRSLRRAVSWVLAGNLTYAGCQWLSIVIIARLLTPVSVGEYAYALATTAPVAILASLKLRSIVATDVRREHSPAELLRLRLIACALALAVIVVLSRIVAISATARTLILIVGIVKLVDTIADLYHGFLQRDELQETVAMGLALNGIVSLAFLGIATWMLRDVVASAIGSLIGSSVAALYAAFAARGATLLRDLRESMSLRWMPVGTLTRSALPAGASSALGSLNSNIPRQLLGSIGGPEQLGVFTALAYLLVAGTMVINAIGQAATPRLAAHYANGELVAFRTLLTRMMSLATVVGGLGVLGAVLVGRPALQFFYGSEYAKWSSVLTLLAAALAITYLYVFLGTAANAMRRFGVQLPVSMTILALHLTASPWLIRNYQIFGAGYALLSAAMLEATLYALIIGAQLRQPLRFGPVRNTAPETALDHADTQT